MHFCENKEKIFETPEFSHNFSKVEEFVYVQFGKEEKGESDRISNLNGK